MRIPLGTSDWSRTLAGEADIPLFNRYFEQNPENQKDQVALLARPCVRQWDNIGTGPIRQFYSSPGTFDDAAFFATGNAVWKYHKDGSTTSSVGTLTTTDGFVSMAATPTYLFIADGTTLHYYTEDDFARGSLTITGTISAAETVTIGTSVYKFATDLTPDADGSASFPWLVAIGLTAAETLQNLYDAIGATGVAGTTYSENLGASEDVSPESVSATALVVRAQSNGTGGNAIATTETLANGSWGGTTLSGGGATAFNTVSVPDGSGIVSVGFIAQFVICVVAQGQGKNGVFYWIEPGEITIDALNFATAERSPDPVWEVKVIGDSFLLPGPNSTEEWYPNGDTLIPFLRQQGRLFDLGVWAGTIVQIDDDFMAVDTSGNVYQIGGAGAAPQLVSTPGISQRLREAISLQKNG